MSQRSPMAQRSMVGNVAVVHVNFPNTIMKRRMAGWSVDFLMQILTGKHI